MEDILLEIFEELRRAEQLDSAFVENVVRRHNQNRTGEKRHFAKKRLLPFYLKVKESDPERWARWGVDNELEKKLIRTLQVKPRRTASGVATITVITKPWKCSSACLYCPNDLRMPKSYLADEPACQRAERNYFDPYLQVASRLRALTHMGHVTDKIELIVLGGTWTDYPEAYQIWFVKELFRALNEADRPDAQDHAQKRRAQYERAGLSTSREDLATRVSAQQQAVEAGTLTYNQAMRQLYEEHDGWKTAASFQSADQNELAAEHAENERAHHRVVGLVIETRPDTITPKSLMLARRLGCTKIQMGIQSLDERILALNKRGIGTDTIREAFNLLRVFGFKIHVHFMANLYGSTVDADKRDYLRLVTEPDYLPDEVKLYPCVLVHGTELCDRFENGTWKPYTEDELLDVLVADTAATPAFVRISRMIRDISAHDIVAGNKKVNLRQLVERTAEQTDTPISEIRYREISTATADVEGLSLEDISYATAVAQEHFLQWTTPEGKIAGFLRLSLPDQAYISQRQSELPVGLGEAMIREVHVYGKVAGLHTTGSGAQHLGLGRQLIETAFDIARKNGYAKMNVISSVGTREYYRSLGFSDNGLYQQIPLT
ncbi:elongator complex protein 3 [Raoultibacter phocaeensis]|uniref:elongator complex protein 3 n=1 Tax=Raoultibacter phocaeensis TaxID=2479841 RepID=UPI0011181BB3|nr:tRNA uridine(34) 5-carboxymethylaminomethyl modification radical SAM/GNAT enzyme Elp3 [Raoultibacter phocaeensis]